ncbi:unnamed protein product [Urochloa decumbens]|uniref:PHD-type zinc finger plants domain-containing protein n=1 Tax=Urochloa decumbens TaxID=240449 RepID=A0ABC9F2W5_9POAL
MASPPPPSPHDAEGSASAAAGAVCCMCGDHGLPGELVRCRRCRVRLQHRYCSDLYPRAAAYRRCNWCLREPADQSGRPGHAAAAAATVANRPEEKRKESSASDEERQRQQRHEGFSSRRPPAELGRPVKKKHKADEKMPPPPPVAVAGAGKGIVTGTNGGKEEVMRAGKARVNRVRVQRYKLLAEVISC